MSDSDHLRLIRAMYADIHTPAGIAAVLDGSADLSRYWHPECVIVVFEGAPTLNDYRGHDGFRNWTRDSFEMIENPKIELNEVLYEHGDDVVVRLTISGRMKTMQMDASFEFFTHYRFQDGVIGYAKGYRDGEEAVADARRPRG